MTPRVVVFGGTELLRARTERSLARFGLRVDGNDLVLDDRPTWLLRAGAWIHAAPAIAPSATKKPLVAIGAIRGDSAWDALASRTKGELGSAPSNATGVRIASVLVESPAALRDALRDEPFDAAVWRIARSSDVRAVRVHDVDVGYCERLRVCIAVTALRRGGAERIAIDHVRALRERDVAVRFVVMNRKRDDDYAAPDDSLFAPDFATRHADLLPALARVASDFGADAIHAHLFDASDLRALAALGPPVVVTVHNDRARWPEGFGAVTCDAVALTLGCSRRTTSALAAEHTHARVRGAPNCVDPERALRGDRDGARRALEIPRGALVVSCIANPRPQKRLELAVSALVALRETSDAFLVIAGDTLDDDAKRSLDEAIAAAHMEPFVRRVGSRTDVRNLYAASDVLLTTSLFEGMSVAQLEALAASVPVVTTDVGGASELARTHEGYRVVDASPIEFARAIASAAGGARPKLSPSFGVRAAAARHERALRGAALHNRATSDELVLVINNFSSGGAQASAMRLLAALHARGHRVAAAVLQEQARFPTPWREELARTLPVFVAPNRNDPSASAASVCDFVRSRRARTVVFWNAMTSDKLRIADELVGARLFDVSPGEMYFSALERFFEKREDDLPYFEPRDYGALLEGVVVKFAAEAPRARDVLGAPVHVVANGVPLRERAKRTRRDRFVVGTLARVSPDKKLEELIDATRELVRAKSPRFEVRIAGRIERGADDYANRLREDARDLPIVWCGEVDANAFLHDLDAFAMVSEPEGCPNALLEAMSAALPIAATSAGGAADAITDGETGLLAPRGDGRALGAALARIAADETLAMRLAENATARIRERYDVERMTDDYEALFFTTR